MANSGPRSLKLCSTISGILPLDEGFAMWWLNMDRAVAEIIPLSVCATLRRTPDWTGKAARIWICKRVAITV
jgi:hypothetical protein